MDAVSDEIPDVDSAGVYFVSVEAFERREPRDRTPEPLSSERPDEGPIESTTRARESARERDDPLSEDHAAAIRRFRDHSTEVSSS